MSLGVAKVAGAILQKYGKACSLKSSSGSALYDPSLGESYGASAKVLTGLCVIGQYKERDIDGGLVKRGDRQIVFTFTDEACEVSKGDIVLVDSTEWPVVEVEDKTEDGEFALWVLQARR